jgi:hypothetical protein
MSSQAMEECRCKGVRQSLTHRLGCLPGSLAVTISPSLTGVVVKATEELCGL